MDLKIANVSMVNITPKICPKPWRRIVQSVEREVVTSFWCLVHTQIAR